MNSSFSSAGSAGHRVYRGACVVLGVVALAQGGAIAMAWKGRGVVPVAAVPGPVAAVPVEGPVEAEQVVEVVADVFAPGSAAAADPHPELAVPAGEEPGVPDPAEPVFARPPVVGALDVPITDERCLGHLDEGIYLRDRGDMVGAVRELRQALALAPEHPKLLYQLAVALDAMAQEPKAAELWRRLRLLGAAAGNYYFLAVERLQDASRLGVAEPVAGVEEKEGRFLVKGVRVKRMPSSVDGEVLTIEGEMERQQVEAADVSKVDIKLHLFDEKNGQSIDRTTALPPELHWLDAPVDWAEGSERFSFEYRQPPFTPDELLKLGRRKYYGYAIEFRYDGNKLQDVAAEPAVLEDMAREIPEASVAPAEGEAFDPAGLRDQPDAVLFPGDRMGP